MVYIYFLHRVKPTHFVTVSVGWGIELLRWGSFTQKLLVLYMDSPYVQDWSAQNFVQDAGLRVRASFSAARSFIWETPRKHAVEPRGCPCRPRSPQRVGVRVRVWVRFRVGSVWADVQGWNWPHTFCTKVLCRPVLHITKGRVKPNKMRDKRDGVHRGREGSHGLPRKSFFQCETSFELSSNDYDYNVINTSYQKVTFWLWGRPRWALFFFFFHRALN